MVNCRSCDDELAENAYFCSNCGLRTELGEKEGVRTPLNERAAWERDVEAALSNATKLMEEAFEAAKRGIQEAVNNIGIKKKRATAKRSTKNAPLSCPKCGEKNPSDALYCTVCGKDIPQQAE